MESGVGFGTGRVRLIEVCIPVRFIGDYCIRFYVCWFLCILCCMVEFGVTYLLCWCTYYTDIIHPQLFGWLTRYPANLDGIHAFDFLLKML